MSRRATLAGGVAAFASANMLVGCAADPDPVMLSTQALTANTELGDRISGGSTLEIAGEPLNSALLQRFYVRHGFEPVWTTRQDQADKLVDAVHKAGEQGLDPALFHANILLLSDSLSPLDRDLLLSDAFLSYADALARGAVPVERRSDDQTLTPEPVDVTLVLDDAMDSDDPAAKIEALAPATPAYQALRQALQKYRAGASDGNNTAVARMRTIEVNLERQRWLKRDLPSERVWVNVADEKLVFYSDDQPKFSTRVVVGQDGTGKQSPEFSAVIDASFFNPPWVIPSDIVKAEIQPKIDQDSDYLSKNDMILLPNGDAEQLPGPEAGLGLIMFDMPNRFDVFLHDTPNRDIFKLDNRRLSHGCIRVQNPNALASLLLQRPVDVIMQEISVGTTTRNNLPAPVPVFVVYQTAFLDTAGTLQFRPDFYNRDADIWQQLNRGAQGQGDTTT